MTVKTPLRTTRPGAFAPLTALLLIPLMGMLAFAIDMGWVVVVQSDLQSAADASALAGVQPLMDAYVQYNLPGQTSAQQATTLANAKTAAKTAAKNYASYNSAGVASLTLLDSDIEFGFTDASGSYSSSSTNFPNTVKVVLRRDSSANGSVGLFFGPVIGKSSQDLTATAAASMYTATVSGFQNVSNFNLRMLPMTYDVNSWNSFLGNGKDPDGNTNTDSSGKATIKIYPSIKDTGNFGLLGLDGSHAGASEVSSWITNGLTQSDLQSLMSISSSGQTPMIPVSSHNTSILPGSSTDGHGSWNWVGDTGLKTSVVHTLSDYVGTTFLMPLFKPLNSGTGGSTNAGSNSGDYEAGDGNGSHYYYNIVGFAAVKLTSCDGSNVFVQPSSMVLDYSQITFSGSPVPAGASGSSSTATTFVAPKLSQ